MALPLLLLVVVTVRGARLTGTVSCPAACAAAGAGAGRAVERLLPVVHREGQRAAHRQREVAGPGRGEGATGGGKDIPCAFPTVQASVWAGVRRRYGVAGALSSESSTRFRPGVACEAKYCVTL